MTSDSTADQSPRHSPDARVSTAPDPTARRPSRPYLPVLDATRIGTVIGVVGIHVLATPVSEQQLGTAWVALRVALSVAVPIFLMMSGALTLTPAAHRNGPRAFLARRAVRIVPALIVWSAFYMLVVQRWSGEPPLGWGEMADRIITGETYTHLYFLWAIAGLYLLAPVIAAFLEQAGDERAQGRRAWVVGLTACGWTAAIMAVPVLTTHEPVQQGTLTYLLLFLGYFTVGRAALAAPVPRPAGILALVLCVPLIALMTLIVSTPDEQQDWWHQVLTPSYVSASLIACSVLMFLGLVSLTGRWRVGPRPQRVLRTLGNATFGVFLVHFAVIVAATRLFPWLAAPQPAAILALWALVVAVSFVAALMGRAVPGLRLIL